MTRFGPLALVVALTSACQTSPPHAAGTRFELGAPVANATAVTAGRLAVAVRFAGSSAARELLATAADVEDVVVKVEGPGVVHEEVLTRAMRTAGSTGVTFERLPEGAYRYRITATDQRGLALGLTRGDAAVVAGQTTTLDATVALSPRAADAPILANLVSPGPPGTADFMPSITLVEPPPVRIPPIEAQYGVGVPGPDVTSLAAHQDGSVWFTSGYASAYFYDTTPPSYGRVLRLAPAGVIEDHTPAHAAGTVVPFTAQTLAIGGPTGRVFLPGNLVAGSLSEGGYLLEPDGSAVPAFAYTSYRQGALDPAGALWTYNRTAVGAEITLDRYPAGGGAARTIASSFGVIGFAIAASGHVWSATTTDPDVAADRLQLTRYDSSGQVTMTRTLDAWAGDEAAMAVDPAGRLWAPGEFERTLRTYAVTGEIVSETRVAYDFNRLHADPSGDIWAYHAEIPNFGGVDDDQGYNDHQIARIAPDGRVLAYYHIGDDVNIADLEVLADGTMWVGTIRHGLLKVKIDAPFGS